MKTYFALSFCLLQTLTLAETANLLPNGDFEGEVKGGVPAGWITYAPTGAPTFKLVDAGAHSGRRCMMVQTPSDMKATLVSDPLPVAPGEKLRLSVWCRPEGVSSRMSGTLGFSAAFLDAKRHYFRWVKGQPATPKSGEWTQFTLEAEVPENAAYMTFQVGHAMVTGRTFWDGAELHAASPIALRFAMSGAQVEPGRQELPLVLSNREPARVGQTVEITVQPGKGRLQHKLTADAEQKVNVPVILSQRGKARLKAAAVVGGQTLATSTFDAVVPPLLVGEPLLPTHWCVEDGPPKIEGRVWVHEVAERRVKLRLTCTLKRGDEVVASTQVDKLPANPVGYSLAPKAGLGDYTMQLALREGEKVVAEAEQDWHVIHRSQAEVRIGPDGFLRVEGKPFFPLGIYNGAKFKEQGEAGFNTSHSYNSMGLGDPPNNQLVKNWLDNSQAAGLRTLMLVSHGLGTGRSLSFEVVRRVKTFRNHPGLLAWDEEEGVARGEVKPSYVQQLYEVLKREAPEHPVMIGDSYDIIFKVDRSRLFPDQYMDMGMWWWYPFPLVRREAGPTAGDSALQGEEPATGTELTAPTFLTEAKTTKPIWLGIQSYKKPERRDGRYPTPTEYRAQAYLGVIHGAKGLMWYGGSVTGGIFGNLKDGHWDYLKQLAGELREMSPVFMAVDSKGKAEVKGAALISTRLKALEGKRVLLAANRSDSPADVTFTVERGGDSPASVRYENRTVPVKAGQFTDRFGPYEVHVYEMAGE